MDQEKIKPLQREKSSPPTKELASYVERVQRTTAVNVDQNSRACVDGVFVFESSTRQGMKSYWKKRSITKALHFSK